MYSTSINIFEYDNFRSFLKDSVAQIRKKYGDEFSYRKFSALAGFASPNFLILLMKGERNLSADGAEKIAKAFGLQGFEKGYFLGLVKFNQAKGSTEKYESAFELVKLKTKTNISILSEQQFTYYSHWSNIAIRELLLFQKNLSSREIACRLCPPQKLENVEKSLQLMQDIGMIKQSEGAWQVVDASVSTGDNFTSTSVIAFHKQVIELAKESLDRHPKADRDITASTVALSRDNLELIRKKVKELRAEILAISESDSAKEEVYQINFQIFPLSKEQNS